MYSQAYMLLRCFIADAYGCEYNCENNCLVSNNYLEMLG